MMETKDIKFYSNDEFIFMKLGISYAVIEGEDVDIDGEETVRLYIKDEEKRGYTWFSTQAWPHGISAKQVKYYNDKIGSGKKVKILFVINNENYNNDIAFSADIMEIFSTNVSKKCPEKSAFPIEFYDVKARTWFKLKNIVEEKSVDASMFEFASTHNNLKQIVSKAQCICGYVSLIKDDNE